MSEYKLIGLDMDGTLLNSKKKITPENMAAIEKAFSQGKEVVLSTGRSVAELREYTDIIKGLKYLVSWRLGYREAGKHCSRYSTRSYRQSIRNSRNK